MKSQYFKFVVIFIFTALLIVSCFRDKKDTLDISGTVTFEETGAIAPNAKVYLAGGDESSKIISSTYTNQNGEYSFNFEYYVGSGFFAIAVFNKIKSYNSKGLDSPKAFQGGGKIDIKIPKSKILKLNCKFQFNTSSIKGIEFRDYIKENEIFNPLHEDGYLQPDYSFIAYSSNPDTILYLPIADQYTKELYFRYLWSDGTFSKGERHSLGTIDWSTDTIEQTFSY